MNYSEQLKNPKWQKKRLEIMQRDGFQCRFCYDRETTLTIHHKYYTNGVQPWEYNDDCYICLCEKCHKRIHEQHLMKFEDDLIISTLKSKKMIYTDIYFFVNRFFSFLEKSSIKQINEMSKILEAQTIKEDEI